MTAIKTTTATTTPAKYASNKGQFVSAVSKAISKLMDRHGYSRDRATSTLLQHLSDEKPSDDEIFLMMKSRSIGLEEARVVLTVSKAFERIVKERDFSSSDAISHLTSRLSVTDLLQSQPPQKPKQNELIRITGSLKRQHSASSIGERQTPPSAANPIPRKISSNPKKPLKAKNTKAKLENKLSAKGLRKRTPSDDNVVVQQINEEKKSTRSRADSVTEEVNAKLSQQQSEHTEATTTTSPSSRQNRTKRSLLDGTVATQPKRARTTGDA